MDGHGKQAPNLTTRSADLTDATAEFGELSVQSSSRVALREAPTADTISPSLALRKRLVMGLALMLGTGSLQAQTAPDLDNPERTARIFGGPAPGFIFVGCVINGAIDRGEVFQVSTDP
jgi:hypothetical protein